ncbi:MAG: TerC family protein [Betaproteobacteria bacterium]|nr:TerC family protein [Betaproteobacteria bacterium]MDE2358949.1 TerC family protein [Betaproteobacteria bacterium]
MVDPSSPAIWVSLGEIALVNILLSGDNAVMIALAARSLPPHQQQKAIIGGSIAAIIILVVLTTAAAELLEFPYLRLAGSVLLFWIAVQLLLPDDDEERGTRSGGGLLAAIRTILVANLIMSMDNVLGVAAVARGRVALLIAGLGISIPVIVFGSTLVLGLMTRFPVIIKLGAALLGWVAGDMLVSDPVIASYVESNLFWTRVHLPLDADFNLVQVLGAVLVIAVGRVLASRSTRTAL